MKKFYSLLLIVLFIAGCGGGGGGTTGGSAPVTYTVGFITDGNGIISGTTSQSVISGGSTTAVTAVSNTGYHFVNWTEGSTVVGTNATLTLSNITSARTIKANFAADSASAGWAVNFLHSTGGTLTGDAVQTVANNGNSTAVTAVPAIGYYFVNWTANNASGVALSTNPTYTVSNVTSAQTVYANFAQGAYDSATGMIASINNVQDVTTQNGGTLNSTNEFFQVTVNVANIPSGRSYTAHVMAVDASGNAINQYTAPDSAPSSYATITGSGSTATITTLTTKGDASKIQYWAVISIAAN